MFNSITNAILAGLVGSFIATGVAQAGPLADRIDGGKTIRIGFSAAPPWAYPGDDGSAKGFINTMTIDVLKKMGYTKVEPVLVDWSALIPSLNAGRVDIVTGGMYVLPARCANMDFSEAMIAVGDVFVVAKGNPKAIKTYQDLVDQDLTMVAVSGYNTIEDAKAAGVPADHVMEVPGVTETLAALRAGRVDAIATNLLEGKDIVKKAEGTELSDPDAFVGRKKQVVGVGFRSADDDIRQKFNEALASYLGTDEMMKTASTDGYEKAYLPGDATTEAACKGN